MGYHIKEIEKGVVGESSKILEEIMELIDAEEQANKIMALCELSDIYLAIKMYIKTHYYDINMHDLAIMAMATERAFESGDRK